MKLLIAAMAVVVATLVVEASDGRPKKQNWKRSIDSRAASCPPYHTSCDNGNCIQVQWVCDTENDCLDGSDEVGCPTNCTGEHQFLCHNGRCISSEFRCDSANDCGDHTDENNCHNVTCPAGEVKCDHHVCIEQAWLCDGDFDCKDHSDEQHCGGTCNAAQFKCHHGHHCIDARWVCDGDDDCHDKSDETNCPCNETHFRCANGKCIPPTWHCDGDNDCGDFSDEKASQCPTIHPSLCRNMMSGRDCALMNDTITPICLDQENGFKFCRKFCGLCMHT